MKPKILIATHNPGKLAYFQKAFASSGYTATSLAECGITTVADETGTTLEDNAIIKATTYGKLSGLITLADDSGLFVDALAGLPGVNSAEYGGKDISDEARISLLLEQLQDVPDSYRTAHFHSVIALYIPQTGETFCCRGSLSGIITREARGPKTPKLPFRQVFLIPAFNKTLDELGLHSGYEQHRAQALHQAIEKLEYYSMFSTQ